jgi:hypothetical protein
MRLTRRTFIMASGISAGALMTGCAGMAQAPLHSALIPRKAKPSSPATGDWVASTCQGCTQWCAVQIYVQNGRATRVRGNPLSKTNHGYCCPRGHLIPQQMYDPDRIKVPMKRTNPAKGRGIDPKFVPITWDEALNIVADKMMELRKAGEPEKLVYMRGRYSPTSTDLLYGTLPKIFGTGQYFSHSAICAEAEKMGPGLTQGFFGYRDYDLSKADCLVCWGTDPLASNRMVPNVMNQFPAIVKRGTVIAVDPRLSNVAAKAHEWLPISPGTDGALAGAIAHVLLTEGLWNKEFVGDFKDGKNQFVAGKAVDEAAFAEKETFGLVKWWNLELKDQTPAWGEKESLIPAAQIVRVARAMGKAAPKTVVWMGPGVAMTPRGTYAAMAVHALNGLLGSIDVEGGVWQSPSGPPLASFPRPTPMWTTWPRKGSTGKKLDGRGAKDMPAMMNAKPGSGVVTNNVANGMLKDPGACKVFISSWSNFNFSCTGADRWDEGPGQGAVLRAHGAQRLGDDDVCRHRAALDFQLGRRLVHRHQHGQRLRLRVDPARCREAPVGREAGRDRGDVAAGRKTQGQRFRQPVRLLLERVQGPRDRQGADHGTGVQRDCRQDDQRADLEGQGAAQGRCADQWLGRLQAKGMFSGPKYTLKKGWGGKFATATKKFEFYSETLKKGLLEHAKKYETTPDDILAVSGYVARGEVAFVPHYETPKRHGSVGDYPFTFIDYKSRLNREGRSQPTCPGTRSSRRLIPAMCPGPTWSR